MRPLVQLLLDVKRVEGLSDQSYDGKPSSIQRVLEGENAEQTPEDARFSRAAGIILAPYYDVQERESLPATEPYPNMGKAEAEALMQWVQSGRCPPDVWATELLHIWDEIIASFNQLPPHKSRRIQ